MNTLAAAAASEELQTAPTSCLEQQYFLQLSWCSAHLCGSQLGSRADAALPRQETPVKISTAGGKAASGGRNREAVLQVCRDALWS